VIIENEPNMFRVFVEVNFLSAFFRTKLYKA
jgi:hypothetical protein